MQYFLALLMICVGVVNIFLPEKMLRFNDYFRLKGEREYSSLAIAMTVVSGFFFIIISIMILVIGFE